MLRPITWFIFAHPNARTKLNMLGSVLVQGLWQRTSHACVNYNNRCAVRRGHLFQSYLHRLFPIYFLNTSFETVPLGAACKRGGRQVFAGSRQN